MPNTLSRHSHYRLRTPLQFPSPTPLPNLGYHAPRSRLPNPPPGWYSDLGGDPWVAFYKWHGIAGSTRSGYNGAQAGYADFCRRVGHPSAVLPAPLQTANRG